MGRECSMFVKKLIKKLITQHISIKRKEELSVVMYGIRCKISYALLRSCHYAFEGAESQIMKIKN